MSTQQPQVSTSQNGNNQQRPPRNNTRPRRQPNTTGATTQPANNKEFDNTNGTQVRPKQPKKYNNDDKFANGDRKKFTRGPRFPPRDREAAIADSKTVFVGRVSVDDITEGTTATLASHYKNLRIESIKDTFAEFGTVESVEEHIEKNFMLITFADRDSAAKAIETLSKKDEALSRMDKIKTKMQAKRMPLSLCPDLSKLRLDWSEKSRTKTVRNAYSHQNQQAAAAVATTSAPAPRTVQPKADKPKAQPTAQASAPSEVAPARPKPQRQRPQPQPAQPVQEVPAPQPVAQPAPVQVAPQPVVVPQPIDTDALRREAEKAKLHDELKYLTNQQQTVQNELSSERERCAARDSRIKVIVDELRRVQQETERLQRQLTAENAWKKAGEDRIAKLEEELLHMHQEQQRVEQRLTHNNNPSPSSWADAEAY